MKQIEINDQELAILKPEEFEKIANDMIAMLTPSDKLDPEGPDYQELEKLLVQTKKIAVLIKLIRMITEDPILCGFLDVMFFDLCRGPDRWTKRIITAHLEKILPGMLEAENHTKQ